MVVLAVVLACLLSPASPSVAVCSPVYLIQSAAPGLPPVFPSSHVS